MEHIERQACIREIPSRYPPQNLIPKQMDTLSDYTPRLAKGLNIIGLMNIQYVISDGEVFVIEVVARQNRSFFVQITGVRWQN